MKRSQAQLLAGAIAACLCVAVVITLRPPGWRARPRSASAAVSPPAPRPTTREAALRFSRDPERLQKLWERLQARQGLDPFTEATPASAATPSTSPAPSNLVITAVWRQRGTSLAVINGRICPEDSEFAHYRITRIGPHDAELAGPGGTIRLDLSLPSRGSAEAGRPAAPTRNPATGTHPTSTASTP